MVHESDAEQDTNDGVVRQSKKMVSLPAEDLEPYKILAVNTRQQFAKLVVEPPHLTELVELLNAAPLAALKCDSGDGGNMLILCDTNGYGEARHRPDIRKPPIPRASITKLVNAVKTVGAKDHAGDDEAQSLLRPGDVWCVIDAGKNRDKMFFRMLRPNAKGHPTRSVEGKTIKCKTLLHKSEKSVMNRQKRTKGGRIHLTESMLEYFNGQTNMAIRERKHFGGSTRSDVLGPVAMPGYDAVPQRHD